tara:strand:+ start:197 stop:589 length:393 start_codon:yes stop_codon:yes gene_type:complete
MLKHHKILLFLFFTFFLISCSAEEKVEVDDTPGPYDDFAKCLGESDLKMYGSYTCSVCRSQRRQLGKSFKYVGEIECNPHAEDNQAELCLELEIAKTPTWILWKDRVEQERFEGLLKRERLAELSGCSLG